MPWNGMLGTSDVTTREVVAVMTKSESWNPVIAICKRQTGVEHNEVNLVDAVSIDTRSACWEFWSE